MGDTPHPLHPLDSDSMQNLDHRHTEERAGRLSRRSTVAILLLALGARLCVLRIVLHNYPAGWLFTRFIEMSLLAKSVLAGHGLSSPFGPPTGPTAFVAPVYPLLIAAVFRLFGTSTTASAIVILSAQIALNLLTIWLMMVIA